MDMAREDLGLVWMGDMLLQGEPLLMDQGEAPFFTESSHPLEDLRSRSSLPQYTPEIDSFMMLDDFDDSYCEENGGGNKFMTSAATQTMQPGSRKIKPVKHPGLKLQTPIAYQRDTDLSVIPIQRDGMAVCEKCGAIGVKHAFYTRERRFCSMQCARGTTDLWSEQQESQNFNKIPIWHTPVYGSQEVASNIKSEFDPQDSRPFSPMPLPLAAETPFPPDKRSMPDLAHSYDWTPQLSDNGFIAASVSCFKHAPMSDCWDNITVGMKIEVENTDCDNFSEDFPDSFWVATVLQIAGYKALLRYEGFGQNNSKDFWVNLCSSIVHPVGWCATRGKPLIPPKTIEDKYKDWKDFLVKRLTGARTLPSNFYNKVHDSLKSRFRCDLNLEVVDKNRLSQVKVATIKKIVGKRLHVRYYDSGFDGSGFWCHEDSPLIHPVGWARRVGHIIDAPPAYVDRCFKGLRDKDDATEDLFPIPEPLPSFPSGICFQEGMKIEAVDPLNLSSICVATVKKVLNDGFLMIRVDSYDLDEDNVSDWFCYHMTSPYILPPGFCSMNSIPVIPPKGYDIATFDWSQYLSDTGAVGAPSILFNREIPVHGFEVGMRLEATDLMDPRLVCVGTVSRIVGRILKIHFDGWEDEYDQWLDCESSDIYPVGWCQLVAHKLEGPRSPVKNIITPVTIKSGLKTGVRKRGRRRMVNKKLVSPNQNKLSPSLDSPLAMSVSAPVTPEVECLKTEPAEANVLTGDMNQSFSMEMNGTPEPAGPDEFSKPSNSPLTSDYNITSCIANDKVIPRLVDSSSGSSESRDLVPDQWNVSEVAHFLRVNDCAAYCDSFSEKKIDGKTLLTLTKDQIIDLTGMKVGPSLKIYDLIQQLKIKVNKSQERVKAGLKKLF